MQFDDFYRTVGEFGRYQKTKYFLICLTYMFPPIMVYTWTFTAATPSFHCRVPLDDAAGMPIRDAALSRYVPSEAQCREYQSRISVHECQRCFQTVNRNQSHGDLLTPCTSFTFDRTYYELTLVEEVGEHRQKESVPSPTFLFQWSMVCSGVSTKSFVQIIFFVGYMVGSLVFGVLSDR